MQEKVEKMMKHTGLLIFAAIIAIGFLKSMFYTVAPEEQGIVLRFGKYARTEAPGFHLKFPVPVERVVLPKVAEIKRLEIGFYSTGRNSFQTIQEQAEMLTGDLNIIECEFIVQYQIQDAKDYLFNVQDPHGTLFDIAETSMRQIIGDYGSNAPLTNKKTEVAQKAKEAMQRLADNYGLGISVKRVELQDVQPPAPVAPAFKSVAAAKENRSRYINEGLSYKNSQVPKAEGEVAQVLNQAKAYQNEKIEQARGDVERFDQIYRQYKTSQNITKTRLYLETMQRTLENAEKVIIDKDQSDILKILNLKSEAVQ